jgi:AcrR family transcriptional regulator
LPKYVDHDQRRLDIIAATTSVLASEGFRGLSLNAVAKQLGGTVTMITHYYSSKNELINDLAARLIESYEADIEEIEAGMDDPRARLNVFLTWALPTSPEGLIEERSRIRLIADCDEIPEIRTMFKAFDVRMRSFMREHLRPLVGEEALESYVEMLRVVTTGVCLATVENQPEWPAARQLSVLNNTLDLMGLGSKEEV